jgi:tRNA(fMet)-specific endonuclease VapC
MASAHVHLMLPDEKTARHYADLYAVLRRQATPIPTNDLWIAALARQYRLSLLTFDAHFANVPGLVLL